MEDSKGAQQKTRGVMRRMSFSLHMSAFLLRPHKPVKFPSSLAADGEENFQLNRSQAESEDWLDSRVCLFICRLLLLHGSTEKAAVWVEEFWLIENKFARQTVSPRTGSRHETLMVSGEQFPTQFPMRRMFEKPILLLSTVEYWRTQSVLKLSLPFFRRCSAPHKTLVVRLNQDVSLVRVQEPILLWKFYMRVGVPRRDSAIQQHHHPPLLLPPAKK